MAEQKPKIAIIEDDLAIVQMYRMKFESEGFEVKTAGDGKTGLRLIEDFQPDIVLLDLMMPVMDGMEMLKQMRRNEWGKDKKVVILTNMGQSEITEDAKQYDIEDFIVKADMTPRQVFERVNDLLG